MEVDFSDLKDTIDKIEKQHSKKENKGLCFRCEHRANFLETGRQPRYECGNIEQCNYGCYMYQPVKPVILAIQDGYEGRPQFGPAMISARSRYAGEPDMHLNAVHVDSGAVLFWVMANVSQSTP